MLSCVIVKLNGMLVEWGKTMVVSGGIITLNGMSGRWAKSMVVTVIVQTGLRWCRNEGSPGEVKMVVNGALIRIIVVKRPSLHSAWILMMWNNVREKMLRRNRFFIRIEMTWIVRFKNGSPRRKYDVNHESVDPQKARLFGNRIHEWWKKKGKRAF